MGKPTAITAFAEERLATTLLVSFIDTFGHQPILGTDDERWAPQTLSLEIAQMAGKLRPQNLDKLMAAVEVITTDSFTTSLPDFIRLCNLFADSPTDGTFDPAEPHEIAWALVETGVLLGGDAPPQFSPEIQGYVANALKDMGMTTTPAVFSSIVANPQTAWHNAEALTDDPEMFAAAQGVEEGRVAEVDNFVMERFQRLLTEIDALNLRTPRAVHWRQQVGKELMKVFGRESRISEM